MKTTNKATKIAPGCYRVLAKNGVAMIVSKDLSAPELDWQVSVENGDDGILWVELTLRDAKKSLAEYEYLEWKEETEQSGAENSDQFFGSLSEY